MPVKPIRPGVYRGLTKQQERKRQNARILREAQWTTKIAHDDTRYSMYVYLSNAKNSPEIMHKIIGLEPKQTKGRGVEWQFGGLWDSWDPELPLVMDYIVDKDTPGVCKKWKAEMTSHLHDAQMQGLIENFEITERPPIKAHRFAKEGDVDLQHAPMHDWRIAERLQMFQNRNEQLAASVIRRGQGVRTTTIKQATRSRSRGKTSSKSRGKTRSRSRGKTRSRSRGKTSSKSRGKTRSKSRGKTRSKSRGQVVEFVSRHRDLNVSMSKFQRLLNEVITLERKINDINMNVLDGIENPAYASIEFPPKSAALKLSNVRLLFKGKLKSLNVIQPQDYNSVTKLTVKDFMMQGRPGESCGKFECGLFHTGESGIAQSGDGGDHGDKWYLVNNAMFSYLQRKLAFMKQTQIGLSVG